MKLIKPFSLLRSQKDPEAKSGIGEQTVLHDRKRWLAKRKDKFKKYWDSYAKKLVKEKY